MNDLLVQVARLRRLGRFDEAEAVCRHTLKIDPDAAEAHGLLAGLLHDRGRLVPALRAYGGALALRPDLAGLHGDRGMALRVLGDAAGAAEAAGRALDLDPGNARVLSNLGNALNELGRWTEAEAALDRALAIDAELVPAWENRGNTRLGQGRTEHAVDDFRAALALAPERASLWYNLANAWKKSGRLIQAIDGYGRARALAPGLVAAHHNLGHALQDLGDIPGALACYRRALEIDPGFATARSNMVFALLYDGGMIGAGLLAAHREWGERHGRGNARAPTRAGRRAGERLRVGYVSPDLCRHSAGYFIEPLLDGHDGETVDIYCYAEVRAPDDVTRRLQNRTGAWRSTLGLDDDTVADLIRADEIDVLVDLAGHTAGNRLGVFARRPAPVQASWLGYPFSTGLAQMDYLIGDEVLTPPGMPALEALWPLARSWVSYRAPDYAPPPVPSPAAKSGWIAFGYFGNLAKLHEGVIGAWAELLKRAPESRLVLNNIWLRDEAVAERFAGFFARHGVGRDRLDLVATAPHDRTLAAYGAIDIALDPFPFNGLTVTCEALWSGVPVVTLAVADRPVGRMGAALLTALGLERLIAQTTADYVEAALSLARDVGGLADLRAGLRPRMAASALGDGRGLARAMEAAYRAMIDRAERYGHGC
jgi:predicted O-linked N-acetylglucosamine transferase (SPINDLY family)